MNLPPRSAVQASLKRHSALLAAQFWGDILFRGQPFAKVSVVSKAGELRGEDGGLVDQTELIIRIAKSRLSEPPRRLEQVTCEGRVWIIRKVAGLMSWEGEWVLTVSQ